MERRYVVDGWITLDITAEQAERWDAGTLDDGEADSIVATLPDGTTGTLAELLAAGKIAGENLLAEVEVVGAA